MRRTEATDYSETYLASWNYSFFGDPKLHRSRPRLPIAIPIAIALIAPFGSAFPYRCTTQPVSLKLHQSPSRKTYHLAQECSVRPLLQKGAKRDLVLGHRDAP
jgi:hypothetical protein